MNGHSKDSNKANMATKAVVQPAAAEIAQIVQGNSGSDHVERPPTTENEKPLRLDGYTCYL